MKRMFTFVMLTIFFFAGCTSTPTRMNGLNLENSGPDKRTPVAGPDKLATGSQSKLCYSTRHQKGPPKRTSIRLRNQKGRQLS
jgi:hypothetical protein